jgi:hypothetical protein
MSWVFPEGGPTMTGNAQIHDALRQLRLQIEPPAPGARVRQRIIDRLALDEPESA